MLVDSVAVSAVSEVADAIADLVGKSLVIKVADAVSAGFRLLETTRVYALDRLTERGAMAEVARRHARYFLGLLSNFDDERRSRSSDVYQDAFRRWADEIHVALDWAFSPSGDTALGVAVTIAAFPLWFELFQMTVARMRADHALSCVVLGSRQEMQLRIGFGHAIWYMTSESDKLEPAFNRALEIAERLGESSVQTQVLWGMWAARRASGDCRSTVTIAGTQTATLRRIDGAQAAGSGDDGRTIINEAPVSMPMLRARRATAVPSALCKQCRQQHRRRYRS
jgi:hypothetical protein